MININNIMAPSPSGRQAPQYPAPLIVPPTSGSHTQSFIILHGRGSNGSLFGLELLRTAVNSSTSLQTAFPSAKFIFPTAAKRRARIYKRTPMHQWFDNWSLTTPTEREELQFDGLRESSAYIHGLLEAEIAAVGAPNVVLWGLSQGCAASLVALLLWRGERFAAVVGMCGWLPLRKRMEDALVDVDMGADDPFATVASVADEDDDDGGARNDSSNSANAIDYLREELDFPAQSNAPAGEDSRPQDIPVFLGHGTSDEKVPIGLDREAAALLRRLEFDVSYVEYQTLGHWYSPEMLCDIVRFLRDKAKWQVAIAE